jgi:hypothetical protein
MIITDEQLKGNWGEQYIAANLSASDCFVRHVTQGQDTGVDLYCEATINGKPILYFWAQVKTSKRWKGIKKSLASPQFKSDHIKYWLTQPVPVFIFLVPDMRKEKFTPFYICRTIDFIDNKTKKFSSFIKIESPDDLSNFINVILPIEIFRWELMNGKVTFLKTTQGQYIKAIPQGMSHRFEVKLASSLINTISQLCKDLIFEERDHLVLMSKRKSVKAYKKHIDVVKPYAEALEKLLYGKNDMHYHNYEALGFYYEFVGQPSKARKNYKKSLEILYADPNTDVNKSPWNSMIRRVRAHLERIQRK